MFKSLLSSIRNLMVESYAFILRLFFNLSVAGKSIWQNIKSAVLLAAILVTEIVLMWGLVVFKADLSRYYELVEAYLLKLHLNSDGTQSSFFPSVFLTAGSSILGVLAITFSLSLFAIQQAAEKHTQSIFFEFIKDGVNKIIFWIIGLISFTFFVFSVIPLKGFLVIQMALAVVFFFITLVLLRWQYRHIAQLVSPLFRIQKIRIRGIKRLIWIDKHLDFLIKAKVIRPAPPPNEDDKE